MIEMISKRLTENQKAEILEAYMAGDNTNSIAEKYSCTPNTINRTVKALLSDSEYSLLKQKRSNISNKKVKIEDLLTANSLPSNKGKFSKNHSNIELDEESSDNQFYEKASFVLDHSDEVLELASENKYNKDYLAVKNNENNFELIEPLSVDFDVDKNSLKSEFKILDYENLPESVYMIVDKKVELESQLISDMPEWSFLPIDELKRNSILLFSNQRSAKRSCTRNQRVIKIPNTSVFKLTKSYLISRGITRLILEDSIIALDS